MGNLETGIDVMVSFFKGAQVRSARDAEQGSSSPEPHPPVDHRQRPLRDLQREPARKHVQRQGKHQVHSWIYMVAASDFATVEISQLIFNQN